MEFIDGHGRVTKRLVPKKLENRKGDTYTYQVVDLIGCQRGLHGVAMHMSGKIVGYDEEERSVNPSVTAYFYSATGKMLWRKTLSYDYLHPRTYSMTEDESRFVFVDRDTLTAIDADGHVNAMDLPGISSAQLYAASPNGNYGAVISTATAPGFIFFDLKDKKWKTYSGPGQPEIGDDGSVRIWTNRHGDWGPNWKLEFHYIAPLISSFTFSQ